MGAQIRGCSNETEKMDSRGKVCNRRGRPQGSKDGVRDMQKTPLSQTVHYKWRDAFPEGGKMALASGSKSSRNKALEA